MTTEHLLPIADGHYTGFVANAGDDWECVDDPVGSPDVSTYVSLSTAGVPTRESVILAALGQSGRIHSVTVTVRAQLAGSPPVDGDIAPFLRIGGADYDAATQALSRAGTFDDYTAAWTANPATGAAWALSDLASLEAGAICTLNYAIGTARITQIYAAVEYTPGVDFSVNGGTAVPGVQADWQRIPRRKRDDGQIDYRPFAAHIWAVEAMGMDLYLSLAAQHGRNLDSLQTTNINDRNNQATYTTATLTGLSGRQTGRRMTSVRVEFLVKVS